MTRKKDNDDFVTITNKDIYNRLIEFEKANTIQHEVIIARQDKTNGKVKLAQWMGTTAMALVVLILGILIQHISK